MQSPLSTSFANNSAEIRRYIDHLLHLADPSNGSAVQATGIAPADTQTIQKMHKASCFLALYNLVESTARLIMEEISAYINRDRIIIRDLSAVLQRSLIRGTFKDYQQQKREKLALMLLDLAYRHESVTCFPSSHIQPTSGNVDARWIRTLASCYGFSANCGPTANGGRDLLIVKNRRNGLAHGDFTFADCGQNYTTADVRKIAENTICFLQDIVDNVCVFLAKRQFSVTASFDCLVGLSETQREALLARFREPGEVFRATEAELLAVTGMDAAAARAVLTEAARLGYA